MSGPEVKFLISVETDSATGTAKFFGSNSQGEKTIEAIRQDVKETLIEVAQIALADEQAQGFDKKPTVYVDKNRDKPIQSVDPLGRIDFVARLQDLNFLLDIYEGIVERSPVETGSYYGNNLIYFNKEYIGSSSTELRAFINRPDLDLKGSDTFNFINVAPYARKLERTARTASGTNQTRTVKSKDHRQRYGFAVSGKKGKQILAPNGVYYLAAKQATRKYGQSVDITFSFIPGNSLGIGNGTEVVNRSGKRWRTTYAAKKTKKGLAGKAGGPYLYPNIRVSLHDNSYSDPDAVSDSSTSED